MSVRSEDGIWSFDGEGYFARVRAVKWPEGAPPEGEVPHAGETVWVELGRDWVEAVVESGIPYRWGKYWRLDVRVDDQDYPDSLNINQISLTPPEKEYNIEVRLGDHDAIETIQVRAKSFPEAKEKVWRAVRDQLG